MTLRVVVVDDHERIRELYRIAFALDGRVEIVGEGSSGDEALALAQTLAPDVLLLDLSMPKRDGLQALVDIKAKAPATRVVVMSGFMRERVEDLVLRLGANAYVEKGVPVADLPGLLLRLAAEPPAAPGTPLAPGEFEARVAALV
jgi:DNA-binding NarL/FixJ family response regulator